MIEGLGQLTIQAIELCNTPIISIHLGETQIWPSSGPSYYWVLTNPTPIYSSGSTLYANGNNTVRFSCRWEKYVQGGSGIPVDSSVVTATPTAPTYFTVVDSSLKFNYNSYKTTQVSSGSRNVTLSYQGQTCDASFNFQGNSYSNISQISALSYSGGTFDASGGYGYYTGGDVYDYKSWTSGVLEQVGNSYKAEFTNGGEGYGQAYHSQNNYFVGTIVPSGREIDIPTLGTTEVAAGSYTFYTKTYNGQSTSLTVNQIANTRSTTHGITIRNNYGNAELTTVDVSAGQQTLQFYVQDEYYNSYTSGAKSSSSTTTISSSNYNVTVYDGSTGSSRNCVSSVTKSGNVVTVYISANTSTTLTRSAIIAVDGNSQYSYISKGFEIAQAVSTATYHYELRNPSVSYSSGNSLSPKQQGTTGSNYATFSAYYCKVNDNNNQVDSSTLVTAVPSGPTGFTTDGNKLYFNYNGYKGTTISAGTKNVTLSYSNANTTTTTFSFSGNSSTSQITQVSLNQNTADASGEVLTFTGGYETLYWSSGYEDGPHYITFAAAGNSEWSTVIGTVTNYSGVQRIDIPSLEKNYTLSRSSYTFKSNNMYNGNYLSFTVYQEANTSKPTTTYVLWDVDASTAYEEGQTITVPSSAGSLKWQMKYATIIKYASGATSEGSSTILNRSYYEYRYENHLGNLVSGITWYDSNYTQQLNYNANGGSMAVSTLIISSTSSTFDFPDITIPIYQYS